MDILFALGLSSLILIWTATQGGWILYPLLMTLGLFCLVHWRRGTRPAALGRMMLVGIRQSSGVLSILMLIGTLVAAWMAAGTVPLLVYTGLRLIQPHLFVLSAFALTAVVSLLIGTAFGAAGTIGLALMIMARSGDVSLHWVAGAIIAGAYVGDRCSPMSSSAHLVATLTRTPISRNLRGMMVTSLVPLLLTVLVYGGASWRYPLRVSDSEIQRLLPEAFNLHWTVGLPAIAIPLLIALRLPVKLTMLISLLVAVGLAVTVQGYSPLAVGQFLIMGFRMDDPALLASILKGGGLVAMGQVCVVVVVSTALAGLLSGTQTFGRLQQWLSRISTERALYGGTLVVSLLMAAYGCTQTITILLTHQLTWPTYQQQQISPEQMALDLENTAVVLSPLIPWNIAGLVPATLLMSDASFVPYAVYLYLLPLLVWLRRGVTRPLLPHFRVVKRENPFP